MIKIQEKKAAYMKNNKVVNISHFSQRPATKGLDAETVRFLSKFKRLSLKEKETVLTLIDAFLLQKGTLGVKT